MSFEELRSHLGPPGTWVEGKEQSVEEPMHIGTQQEAATIHVHWSLGECVEVSGIKHRVGLSSCDSASTAETLKQTLSIALLPDPLFDEDFNMTAGNSVPVGKEFEVDVTFKAGQRSDHLVAQVRVKSAYRILPVSPCIHAIKCAHRCRGRKRQPPGLVES